MILRIQQLTELIQNFQKNETPAACNLVERCISRAREEIKEQKIEAKDIEVFETIVEHFS